MKFRNQLVWGLAELAFWLTCQAGLVFLQWTNQGLRKRSRVLLYVATFCPIKGVFFYEQIFVGVLFYVEN